MPHIYAVGDVIGFPALAATSMEQGRLAAYHACDEPVSDHEPCSSRSASTRSPEISFVGATEDELTDAHVAFETGLSRYRELARGQIIGDTHGMLKLLVSPEDRKLLGVHVFGTQATELVHIGQAVMGCGGTIDYLVDAVFNYPTLSECYKVAALDAMNKLQESPALHAGDGRAQEAIRARRRGSPPGSSSARVGLPCGVAGEARAVGGDVEVSPARIRRCRGSG